MEDLSKRILEVMAHLKLSKVDFAQKLGISSAVLSHISSGRNKPGLDLIVGILTHYNQVSADWLLLGNGVMIRDNSDREVVDQLLKLIDEVKLLNEMNYNGLSIRIEALIKRISTP
jgi:transcriptional regulator with XRE-family HTH domain